MTIQNLKSSRALKKALTITLPEDFIFVGGSNYLVGEFLKEFN